MRLVDYITWLRLGRPAPGAITSRIALSYPFEEGAETTQRLTSIFGELSRLTALDLGAGPGETFIARQILDVPWKRLISVEAFPPYVRQLREKKSAAAQHVVLSMRIEEVFRRVKAGEVDLVLLIDVLEHLRRRDALNLLRRLHSFANRGIVLFLPLGHVEQEPFDQNALQEHQSFWRAEDLALLGFTVSVYGGLHGQLEPPADAAWAIKKLPAGPYA